MSGGELAVGVVELKARVERLLARPAIVHAGNRRLLKHLGRERDHLFTFLRRRGLGSRPPTGGRSRASDRQ